jgi:hypothetical protein
MGLHSMKQTIMARERQTGQRDLAMRRRFNALLRGGGLMEMLVKMVKNTLKVTEEESKQIVQSFQKHTSKMSIPALKVWLRKFKEKADKLKWLKAGADRLSQQLKREASLTGENRCDADCHESLNIQITGNLVHPQCYIFFPISHMRKGGEWGGIPQAERSKLQRKQPPGQQAAYIEIGKKGYDLTVIDLANLNVALIDIKNAATLEQAEAVWAREKFNRKQINVATNFIREWRGPG